MERKEWIEDAIEKYIREHPWKDSVDIVAHFHIRADVIMDALAQLVDDKRIVRKQITGISYGYVLNN